MSAGDGDSIRDPRALRALTHPLRWRLLDLLTAEGSATATLCAEALGESVASCSYHLNILAKYGFIEQDGVRRGRQKPWRVTSSRQNWSPDDLDREGALAAEAATEVFLDHEVARLKERLRGGAAKDAEWRRASRMTGVTTFLTAAELHDLGEELAAVAYRFADRLDNVAARPHDAQEVRVFFTTSVAPTSPTREGRGPVGASGDQ